MMTELEALVALNQLPKLGPIRIRRLLQHCGSATAVLKAKRAELAQVSSIGETMVNILTSWEKHADPATELAEAHKRGIQILTTEDDCYPNALRQLPDSPIVLYVWGELTAKDEHGIGIVGSRKLTHYGRDCARRFAYQLAGAGLTVISGLARGIDTMAHEGAIAGGGRTVAVLGSGLLQLYPPENLALAEKIAGGHGAVVSEFPLHTPPDRKTFPQRNRIVAGWSRSLLVVECPARSGSLITANMALEGGKQIFAIPGPIDRPSSAGCHQLIRDGAILVTDATQILDEHSQLNLSPAPEAPAAAAINVDLTTEEQQIVDALGRDERSIDDLVEATKLPAHQISVSLMRLELNAVVLTLPGQRYRLRH